MRPLSRGRSAAALATAVVGALAATLVAAPASAVPTMTIKPTKLSRGADVAIPHLEGKTVVDGSVRIKVKAPTVRLVGKSGTAYVVGTAGRTGRRPRAVRPPCGFPGSPERCGRGWRGADAWRGPPSC